MTALRIPCPHCGSELKLPSRKLLGRKARCPKCQEQFVIREPDEVELELADPPEPIAPQLPTGTAPRWVPDAPTQTPPPRTTVDDQTQFESPQIPDFNSTVPAASTPGPVPNLTETSVDTSDSGGVSRLRAIRERNRKRRNMTLLFGGIGSVLLLGGFGYLISRPSTQATDELPPVVNQEWADEKQELEESASNLDAGSPTSGTPIELNYFPAGSRIVAHLRPADLWNGQPQNMELLACMKPFDQWLAAKVTEYCHFPATQVEQVTFGVILGSRGAAPEVAAVVKLNQPPSRTDLLSAFGGERSAEHTMSVYRTDSRVYIVIDDSSFAVGPVDRLDEMLEAQQFPGFTSNGIDELLKETDTDRLATVLFEPQDLDVYGESLFTERVLPAISDFNFWLTDDVEAIAWSVHLGDKLVLDTRLRNQTVSSPAKLQRSINGSLKLLPQQLTAVVEKMHPRGQGAKMVLERFPEMVRAIHAKTTTGIKTRSVLLSSRLSERAAPNLALAGRVIVDELARGETTAPVEAPSKPQLPNTVAERLNLPITVEFVKRPLKDAFADIATEIQVGLDIDGDSLKLSGYTQNMEQNQPERTIPAVKAIGDIVAQYSDMVVVVDEARKMFIVTTKVGAETNGLQPISLPQ